MPTISLCMIVKNEADVLGRCLDSLKCIADEMIIVDTGSSDNTKEIARGYTNQIYDFEWKDDFAAARNFSFSKAKMDYIYVADADEVLDEKNQERFQQLKSVLLPEIEIVQMMYTNQLAHNTTYNFNKEYRPKLYKRLREFWWSDPIHEMVNIQPVIFDSDIEVIHLPAGNHASRDFGIFKKQLESGACLSYRLIQMYARELFIAGTDTDFTEAYSYFLAYLEQPLTVEQLQVIQCVVARAARISGNIHVFLREALKNVATGKPSAEICFELGEYYASISEYREAIIWYYNAAYETEPELNIHYGGDYPLKALRNCHKALGEEEEAIRYETLAEEWKIE